MDSNWGAQNGPKITKICKNVSRDPSWERSGKKAAKSPLPDLPRDLLMWVWYSKYHIELNVGKSRFGTCLAPFWLHFGATWATFSAESCAKSRQVRVSTKTSKNYSQQVTKMTPKVGQIQTKSRPNPGFFDVLDASGTLGASRTPFFTHFSLFGSVLRSVFTHFWRTHSKKMR